MMKKRVYNFLMLLLLLIVLTACASGRQTKVKREEGNSGNEANKEQQPPLDEPVYNEDGTITLPEGSSAYGLYDNNHKLYENLPGDNAVADIENGEFSAVVNYQQNYSQLKNYILILMVDFEQHDFTVDGTLYDAYRFSLEGDTEIAVPFTLSGLEADAMEMEWLIFQEPDALDLSIDDAAGWDLMYDTQLCCSGRLRFNEDFKQREVSFHEGKELSSADGGHKGEVSLTASDDEIIIMPRADSGQRVQLILGNYYEEEKCDLALAAFCGWKQVKLWGDSQTGYVSLPADGVLACEVELPEVSERQPYQVIAFEKPFAEDISYAMTGTTMRTIIQRGD